MKRYKLLTTKGYSSSFVIGKVYGENEKSIIGLPIKDYVKDYPADWQLIEENKEKRPIMTYVILSVMMALYLYAGLAETNWPLWPASAMGFYLLFKIERNGGTKVL